MFQATQGNVRRNLRSDSKRRRSTTDTDTKPFGRQKRAKPNHDLDYEDGDTLILTVDDAAEHHQASKVPEIPTPDSRRQRNNLSINVSASPGSMSSMKKELEDPTTWLTGETIDYILSDILQDSGPRVGLVSTKWMQPEFDFNKLEER